MSGFGYRIDGGKAQRIAVKEALDSPAGMVWVHLSVNNDEAKAWLRDVAKLPEYLVEALTAQETRPRCDDYETGAYLNLRGRTDEDLDADLLASVRIWATKGRVISVTRKHLIATDMVEKQVQDGTVDDPGDVIAAFATAITNDLDPVVAELGDQIDDCEQELDSDRVYELRRRVTHVRIASIGYRRFLNPQRAALEKLAQIPGDWLATDDRAHVAAAADRAARMAEELEAIRERSSLIHETLTDLRAELIDTRSLIIAIAAMVFLPLTFITGLYGMNVAGLPYAQKPWAFDAIMAICAAISLGTVVYFMRRHWFRR
ncbi:MULTISPECIES: CorA family divalent cation transporter [unclassified Sphingomonas]|uniref:CorA family divalent cation transporter n=1 Tax=unclassified Sphingomonas TaxID=196159 RepID=UPI00092AEB74|nr:MULTISPECIES: CorA family divalent cation transporter [unclassified Sphingomonas]MBN8849579.1 zinc transporter ZntB [Sphingomonas sp.]OJV31060.1 MAG: zinc transporter ZntB [Sphingomonas sp. 67-36]